MERKRFHPCKQASFEYFQEPLENSDYLSDILSDQSHCLYYSRSPFCRETNNRRKKRKIDTTNEDAKCPEVKKRKMYSANKDVNSALFEVRKLTSQGIAEDFLASLFPCKSLNQRKLKPSDIKFTNVKQATNTGGKNMTRKSLVHPVSPYLPAVENISSSENKGFRDKPHKKNSRSVGDNKKQILVKTKSTEEDFLLNFLNSASNKTVDIKGRPRKSSNNKQKRNSSILPSNNSSAVMLTKEKRHGCFSNGSTTHKNKNTCKNNFEKPTNKLTKTCRSRRLMVKSTKGKGDAYSDKRSICDNNKIFKKNCKTFPGETSDKEKENSFAQRTENRKPSPILDRSVKVTRVSVLNQKDNVHGTSKCKNLKSTGVRKKQGNSNLKHNNIGRTVSGDSLVITEEENIDQTSHSTYAASENEIEFRRKITEKRVPLSNGGTFQLNVTYDSNKVGNSAKNCNMPYLCPVEVESSHNVVNKEIPTALSEEEHNSLNSLSSPSKHSGTASDPLPRRDYSKNYISLSAISPFLPCGSDGVFKHDCDSHKMLSSCACKSVYSDKVENSLPENKLESVINSSNNCRSTDYGNPDSESNNLSADRDICEDDGSFFHTISLTPSVSTISLQDFPLDMQASKPSNKCFKPRIIHSPDKNNCFSKGRKLREKIGEIIKTLCTDESLQECDTSLKNDTDGVQLDSSVGGLKNSSSKNSNILEGLNIFVDVWCDENNFSECVEFYLREMGCQIAHRITPNVTHLIFKEGHRKHFLKALKYNILIVSVLWVEMCRSLKTRVPERLFPATVDFASEEEVKGRVMISREISDTCQHVSMQCEDGRTKEQWQPDAWNFQSRHPTVSSSSCVTTDRKQHTCMSSLGGTDSDITIQSYLNQLKEQPECTVPNYIQSTLPSSSSGYSSDKSRFYTNKRLQKREIESRGKVRSKYELNKKALESRVEQTNHTDYDDNDTSSLADHNNDLQANSEDVNSYLLNDDLTNNLTPTTINSGGNTVIIKEQLQHSNRHSEVQQIPTSASSEGTVLSKCRNAVLEYHNSSLKVSRNCVEGSHGKIESHNISSKFQQNEMASSLNTVSHEDSTDSTNASKSIKLVNANACAQKMQKGDYVESLHHNLANSKAVVAPKNNHSLQTSVSSMHSNQSIRALSSSNDLDFLASLLDAAKSKQLHHTNKKTLHSSVGNKNSDLKNTSTDSSIFTLVVTNLSASDQDGVCRAIDKLGKFQFSARFQNGTTHVVCGRKHKTINVVLAVASGCWLLSPDWVFKSEKEGHWLPEEHFELSDWFPTALENRWKKMMDVSQDLFMSLGKCYVSPHCSVPRQTLINLINISGGKTVRRLSDCETVVGEKSKVAKRNINFVTQGWIMDCIMEGKLLPVCTS